MHDNAQVHQPAVSPAARVARRSAAAIAALLCCTLLPTPPAPAADAPYALDILLPGHAVPDGARAVDLELLALESWWRHADFVVRDPGRGPPENTRWHARVDLAPARAFTRISAPYAPWSWAQPEHADVISSSLEATAQGGVYLPLARRTTLGVEAAPLVLATPLTAGAWSRYTQLPILFPVRLPDRKSSSMSALVAPRADLLYYGEPGEERSRLEAGLCGGVFSSRPSALTGVRARVSLSLAEKTTYSGDGADYAFETGPSAWLGSAGAAFVRLWPMPGGTGRVRLEVAAGGSRSDAISSIDTQCDPCNNDVTQARVTREDFQSEVRLGASGDVAGRFHLGGELRVGTGAGRSDGEGWRAWQAGAGMVTWLRYTAGRFELMGTFALSRATSTTLEGDPLRVFQVDAAGRIHILFHLAN